MSNLFGWDLLYGSIEKDIKSNQDILICLTHLVLISNGFKCIGIGDSKNLSGNETKTETLPKGWNDSYSIRYVYQGRLYNLKGTRLDDGVIINLIRVDERNVSMVQLNTRVVVKRSGTLEEMIPDSSNIADTIKKQLIDKVVVSKKMQDGSSQTPAPAPRYSESNPRGPPISPLCEPPRRPCGNFRDPLDVTGVGRTDLDPFGGLGPLGRPGPAFVPPGGKY